MLQEGRREVALFLCPSMFEGGQPLAAGDRPDQPAVRGTDDPADRGSAAKLRARHPDKDLMAKNWPYLPNGL